MTKKAFALHMKPGGQDVVPLGLSSNELIIGWPDALGLTEPALDQTSFRDIVHDAYFPMSPTRHSAASNASSLWNFIRVMQVGDYVVVPHGKVDFYVGMVAGEPYFHSKPNVGGYRRPVHWVNDGLPFSREGASGSIQHVLGLRRTCQDATFWLSEIEAFLLSDGIDPIDVELTVDLELIGKSSTVVGPTTTRALIDARLGQGQFRTAVLARWGNGCAVTGCSLLQAIRASHLKPWRRSNDNERLDPSNGLPLLATLDALFDRGLISFNSDGEMLISKRVPTAQRKLLGVPLPLRRSLSLTELEFIEIHRATIFK